MRTVYAMHGVASGISPDQFIFKNLMDKQQFVNYLRLRPDRFVDLDVAADGRGGALTIDDATMASAEAARLARQHGHAVTFFINPWHVATGKPYALGLLNVVLDRTRQNRVFHEGTYYNLQDEAGKREFRDAIKSESRKLTNVGQRLLLIERVADLLKVQDLSLPEILSPITKKDVLDLIDYGVRIENHGWTHSDLRQIPRDAVRYEIEESSQWFERELGINSRAFAVSFGEGLPDKRMYVHRKEIFYLLDSRFFDGRIGDRIYNRRKLRI